MGYTDPEEEMTKRVYMGAAILGTTLSQMDIDREIRVMGSLAAISNDLIPVPIEQRRSILISIRIVTFCDLVLKFFFLPLISMLNRTFTRAEKQNDYSLKESVLMTDSKLAEYYESWESMREKGYIIIDAYYNQWYSYTSKLDIDRMAPSRGGTPWSAMPEKSVEDAKRAKHARQDETKDKKRKGKWPKFKEAKKLVGDSDLGKPTVPSESDYEDEMKKARDKMDSDSDE